MKSQTVKTVNYNADIVNAIVDDYTKSVLIDGSNNSEVLDTLSKKYGKSVHSLRAKLAQLKAYVKADNTTTADKKGGIKKSDLVHKLEILTNLELDSFESATRAQLESLCSFIEQASA